MVSGVGVRREGNGELVCSGYQPPVWEDEQVPEMHGGVGCVTTRTDVMPHNCMLKNAKMYM